MILDNLGEFCDATSVALTAGASWQNIGDVIDTYSAYNTLQDQAAKDKPIFLVVSVGTGISVAANLGAIQFRLVSDATSTPDVATSTVHWTSNSFLTVDPKSATVTFTNATNVCNWTGHALVANTPVRFSVDATGVLPTAVGGNLSVLETYYTKTILANTFELSRTSGGATIDLTNDGTATITGYTSALTGVLGAIQLPHGKTYERYLGMQVLVSTVNTDAGTINAFLTQDAALWSAYADNVS